MNNDDENYDVPPPTTGRGAEFGRGMLEGPGGTSPGLAQQAARWNSETPKGYVPTGSSSGMSADQYQATFGGQYGNSNGSAESSWETKKFFSGREAQ
jgi:hypothetical protein